MNRILSRLTRAAVEIAPNSDGSLLDAFLGERSEPAFASLVERHGPMVLAVCTRVLRNHHDAEDAFQATFLVLARRAADVKPRDAIATWLYGVAHRVALKARAVRSRRLVREQPLGERPAVAPESPAPELAETIDRALRALPQLYRAAVVACDLEGLSRAEAAEQLGWKEGTLSGRLARARQLLADRLRRAGVVLPAGGVGAVLGTGDAVGAELAAATVRVAVGSCGKNLASGVSAPVAALTEGVVRGMFVAKLKAVALVVLAAGMLGFGVWASAGAGAGSGTGAGDNPGGTGGAATLTATDPKPPAKRHPDLEKMQGNWWILAIGDGNKLQSVDPNAERDPRQFAVTIRDDQFYFPNHPAFRGVVGVGKITLDPAKTPKHIDIAHEGGTFPGVYEFVVPNPKDQIVQLRLSLPPPGAVRSAGFRQGGPGAVELVLGRFVDPKRDPSTDAGLGRGAKLDLTAAQERHELVRHELELALGDIKARGRTNDLDRLEVFIERDRLRLHAMMQLLDQAELELVKARLRAKPAPKLPAADTPGAADLLADAKARREIERQRAVVILNDAKRTVTAAQAEAADATVRAREAELKLVEAQRALDAAQKAFDELFAEEKPEAPFEIRGDNGNRIPFSENDSKAITELVVTMLGGCRGELTGGKGTPFATAERWQQLQKAGHVVVRFPKKRAFPNVANNAEVEVAEILVPVSGTRTPEIILTRSGDIYRAFFDVTADNAKTLQKAVTTLAK
jgi:RNA polymerase sigma factor (sigma-70 family)